MGKAIIADHLSYLDKIKDTSFTIQKGELVGIIGASDSGTNLILKIISGIYRPTSGFVSVLGHDPYLKSAEYLKCVSFVSGEKKQILRNSPPIDSLEITKVIYELTDRNFNKNLNDLTQFVRDPFVLDALIYKPQVLFLDNINSELDTVYEYNKKFESTNLISTEKIDILINLVRRIIIFDKDTILFDGAIDEIIEKYAKEKIIKAKLSSTVDIKMVNQIATVKKYSYPYLYVSSPRTVVSFTAAELLQNFPITSISIEELSIEEIVKNMKI